METVTGAIRTEGITGKKVTVEAYGIKSGIAKEGFGVDEGMGSEKIFQGGDEQPCIMDGFIFIRGSGFLFEDNLRMAFEEIPVIELDMPHNAESIGDNAELIGITEMAVNVELLNFRIGGRVGWHGTVSSFIRVIAVIKMHCFCIGFELFDDTVGIFGIIFGYPGFNTGGIEDTHICPDRVNCLTDRFCKVNKA